MRVAGIRPTGTDAPDRSSTRPMPPRSASHSQAVMAAGLVFVAGQGPFDPTTGAVVGTTISIAVVAEA